jgi:YcxB-like protein
MRPRNSLMTSEPTGYRFIDPVEENLEFGNQTVVHSVEFYPSIDDYVYIARQVNRSNAFSSWTKFTLQAFFVVNAIGLPAVLLYFGYLFPSIAIFTLNIFFASFFLPAITKFDYRRFFRSIYGNLENELVRVELTNEGVFCRHLSDVSFHSWRSITAIEETEESIFFHLRGTAIIARKSGFPYEDQKKQFLEFGRNHQRGARESLPLNDR